MAEIVIGIGIDLVEMSRIADSHQRFGERFLHRIYLPGEVEYSMKHADPTPFLAARFAAKEAVSKAFGTGIGKQLGWRDMEVCKWEGGEPYLVFHGKGEEFARRKKVVRAMISLTHTKTHAAAVAVLIAE